VARLEVDAGEMERAFALREQLAAAFRHAGFEFVTQDLEGFRSGSLDGVLASPAADEPA
jgi:PP-loop superfamily ATP-utilizing enzyme